ncbi:MAG: hypothetical protein JXC32_19025 [Anaerolineae bacterium]|nr:hypothetical protein [Anaerolineae bacterium]
MPLSPMPRMSNAQSEGIGSPPPFEVSPSPTPRAPASRRLPQWRALLAALLNPAGARPDDVAFVPWILTLAISGAAFGLFFLQTGLDRLDAGTIATVGVLALLAVGLLYGTLGVLALALVAWIVLSVAGSRAKPQDVIRGLALAYSPTLVALVLGLLAHVLLGWRTAVAFGVAGVLWALGPMNSTLRRLSQGKAGLSIVLATICGAVLLLGWALLGTIV